MKQACIRCVVRLILCFRFGHSERQTLPPAVDPQGSLKRGRITYKLPTLSPLLLPARVPSTRRHGTQETGQVQPAEAALWGSWLGAKQSVLEQPGGCSVLPPHGLSCSLVIALPPHPTPPSAERSAPARPGKALGDAGSSAESCCAGKWSRWESCSYPEIRHATDNGSPSSSHIPVKGTLFLNNLRNI